MTTNSALGANFAHIYFRGQVRSSPNCASVPSCLPMRSLEISAGSQLPASAKAGVRTPALRDCATPPPHPPAPLAFRASDAQFQRTCTTDVERRDVQKQKEGLKNASCTGVTYSFRSSPLLSSFIQLCRSVVPSGSPGAGSGRVGERGEGSGGAESPEGAGEGGRPDRRAGPRGCARASGRTGPGGQCAFVYVARAAAANMHLKSPRVSARQRPAAQSPRRRAPRTPGPRSLWYISDLTSRAGPILRWEPFWVHLGSQLGFLFLSFFFFFRKRCDLSTLVRAAHRATSHPPPPNPAPPLPPGLSHVGEGATKAWAERNPRVGQCSRAIEDVVRGEESGGRRDQLLGNPESQSGPLSFHRQGSRDGQQVRLLQKDAPISPFANSILSTFLGAEQLRPFHEF
nr:uncharacterized protein LOC128780308 [Desmodus rotundus]